MRISIKYRLFAVITLLIVIMTSVIGTVMITRQRAQYLDQLTQFGVYITSYLAKTSAEPLLFGDELAMSLMVRDVSRNPQVVQVMIVDKSGVIRAHNILSRLGTLFVLSDTPGKKQEIGSVTVREKNQIGEPTLEFAHPIVYQNMAVGAVYLTLTRLFIEQDIFRATWFIIAIAAALIIVGAFVSLVLSTVLLRPVQNLVRGTEEIAQGNFDHRVEVIRNDEMGDLAEAFNIMAKDLRLKHIVEESFGRYVSPDIVNTILSNPEQVWMTGTKREVSLFFADIRGFTSLTEKNPPEQIVSLLNRYFSMATEVIVRHNGFINKFVGDEVMAVFGAPVENNNHPASTIRTLLDLRDGIAAFNRTVGIRYDVKLGVGMGATVGPVIAGNVGSQTRMEYTVMGDSVNVASRLTQMAAANEILISAELYGRIQDIVHAETVGPVQVKGREKWVMVHRVISLKEAGV